MALALRSNPVKNSARLSSRSKSVSRTQLERGHIHLVVAVELEAGDAPVGRDVLVLLAHRRSQAVDLDLAGQTGDLAGVQRLLLERTERLDQRGGERPRRTESGARWDVGERGDLDLPGIRRHHPQRLAHDGVLHIVHAIDVFQMGVLEEDPGRERANHRHVDVLVDGGGDESTAVVAIVGRQIGSPPTQRDTQRASHDDHDCDTSYILSTTRSAAMASESPGAGCRPKAMSW